MRIDGLNIPLLRSWNWFGADFYKDVTPTAFDVCRANMTGKIVIQKIFDELPVP